MSDEFDDIIKGSGLTEIPAGSDMTISIKDINQIMGLCGDLVSWLSDFLMASYEVLKSKGSLEEAPHLTPMSMLYLNSLKSVLSGLITEMEIVAGLSEENE